MQVCFDAYSVADMLLNRGLDYTIQGQTLVATINSWTLYVFSLVWDSTGHPVMCIAGGQWA